MELLEERHQFAGGQLSSVGREWAGELDFPNADLRFCLGLEAAGKGDAQKWELRVAAVQFGDRER
jgi:hypothetical protein